MFKRVRALATTTLISVALVGCADPSSGGASPTTPATQAAASDAAPSSSDAASTGESPAPNGATCPAATGDDPGACQIVLATANIFGAGRDEAPAPGDGGPGTLPSMWPIPAGATTMSVSSTTGLVRPTPNSGLDGAGGAIGWITDVSSFNGISGIVHRKKGMFLVGVFLTDETPVEGEHPERLGFTDGEDFAELAPEIGQTFFIGDGVGRRYVVPNGSTRLFLGFADAREFQGDPGYYGNNSGELAVTVEFPSE